MNLLQRIIEHLQNLVLVSDITIMLISISLILMSCAYVYSIFAKKNKYESLMVKLGIFIRILMFIGFTIEFSHQRTALADVDLLGVKDKAMNQFSNYLFYGYLFIVGIYYIVTIGINKFKGFFYTFDLTMTSIPLLYILTAMIFNLKEVKETPLIAVFVLSLFMLPYLFFKAYWKKNIKWCSIFFPVAIVQVITIAVLHMQFGLPTVMSYLLIGVYEICRVLFKRIMESVKPGVLNSLRIASLVFPLILIFSSVAALNVKPMIFSRKYEMRFMYNKNIKFTPLEDAKALARAAVGSENGEVKLWQSNTEDFHNIYRLSINKYAIDVIGVTGKLMNIHYIGERKASIEKEISDMEIKQKTVVWLKRIGYTYDDNIMEMNISREKKNYLVKISRKYSDGKFDNDSLNARTTVEWFSDGELYYASVGSIFSLSDYNRIKINENRVRDAIVNWYTKLGEETPVYRISALSSLFDLVSEPNVSIKCSNGDSININAVTGNVSLFSRDRKRDSKLASEKHSEFEEKAINLAKKYGTYDSFNYEIDNKVNYFGKDNYYFSNKASGGAKYILIRLDSEGSMASFQQNYSGVLSDGKKLYRDIDFKVSSNEAINKVSSLYKPFGIYSKRVKLVTEVDENGAQKFKWMVVVMTFNTAEHHIYFVDSENGEISPLLEYKAGVKDVKR
jgi:hypothetical protein